MFYVSDSDMGKPDMFPAPEDVLIYPIGETGRWMFNRWEKDKWTWVAVPKNWYIV